MPTTQKLEAQREAQDKADRFIRLCTRFWPNPRVPSLSWKPYSRYRERCDGCTCEAAQLPPSDRPEDRMQPQEKMPDYEQLVRKAMLDGPHERFGGRQLLTSQSYGWYEPDMFTKDQDDFDRECMVFKLKKTQLWRPMPMKAR